MIVEYFYYSGIDRTIDSALKSNTKSCRHWLFMLSSFGCRQNFYRNKCPRGCVITRANAAESNTVRSSTKIKAAGGYITMGRGVPNCGLYGSASCMYSGQSSRVLR
jgi:hypothetical protein